MHVLRSDLEKLVVGHGSDLAAIQTHFQSCPDCQAEAAEMLGDEWTPARIKVVDPITSLGASAPAELLAISSSGVHARVSSCMFVGAVVQVRSSALSAFGRVRYCVPAGSGFQIGVKLQEIA